MSCSPWIHRQISNIKRTRSQNFKNVSLLVLRLYLPNPLKPCVKSRMKMQLEQRRQAMLQLHLSDQEFYCIIRCVLYERMYGTFYREISVDLTGCERFIIALYIGTQKHGRRVRRRSQIYFLGRFKFLRSLLPSDQLTRCQNGLR